MTSDQIKPLVASTVRHGLTLLAGFLVARGAFSPTTAGGIVESLSGVVVGLIGYGWSLARAGRLGSQAKTICDLIESLANSVPLAAVNATSAMIAGHKDAMAATVANAAQKPADEWPRGRAQVSTMRETNPSGGAIGND